MIAKEGLWFILGGLMVTLAFVLAAVRWDSKVLIVMAGLFSLLSIFTIFFFRDPERAVPDEPGIVVAPADGKVLAIDTLASHDYVGPQTQRVSIFLSIIDVHINRIPVDSRVDFVKYRPGRFHAAFLDKASEFNERNEVGLVTRGGARVLVSQIPGTIARRIVCKLSGGEEVRAGDRFGMIRFGSRTELFLPAKARIEVKPGQHVAGGATVIGYLPSERDPAAADQAAEGRNVKL